MSASVEFEDGGHVSGTPGFPLHPSSRPRGCLLGTELAPGGHKDAVSSVRLIPALRAPEVPPAGLPAAQKLPF